jgi:hypothetical protein
MSNGGQSQQPRESQSTSSGSVQPTPSPGDSQASPRTPAQGLIGQAGVQPITLVDRAGPPLTTKEIRSSEG